MRARPAAPLPSRRALGAPPAAPCPPLFPVSFHGDAPPGARGFSMVTAAPPPRAAAPLLRPLSLLSPQPQPSPAAPPMMLGVRAAEEQSLDVWRLPPPQ